MEELKLEHLAPYLPYKLNTKYLLSDVIDLITDRQKDEIRDKRLTDDNVSFVLSYCKPILRPLSDLIVGVFTEETIHKLQCKGIWAELTLSEWGTLFEFHFDVFELIKKGLAIDINTL